MKAYITKFALTKGITEQEVIEVAGNINMVREVDSVFPTYYHRGEWHLNREDAIIKANEIKQRKLLSMEKQISKIKNILFILLFASTLCTAQQKYIYGNTSTWCGENGKSQGNAQIMWQLTQDSISALGEMNIAMKVIQRTDSLVAGNELLRSATIKIEYPIKAYLTILMAADKQTGIYNIQQVAVSDPEKKENKLFTVYSN